MKEIEPISHIIETMYKLEKEITDYLKTLSNNFEEWGCDSGLARTILSERKAVIRILLSAIVDHSSELFEFELTSCLPEFMIEADKLFLGAAKAKAVDGYDDLMSGAI